MLLQHISFDRAIGAVLFSAAENRFITPGQIEVNAQKKTSIYNPFRMIVCRIVIMIVSHVACGCNKYFRGGMESKYTCRIMSGDCAIM